MKRSTIAVPLGLLVSVAATSLALAQQITGTPGSTGATTTIDGRYLPNPPPSFRGAIAPNADESKPYWQPLIVPPKGAPNILLIMTDDVGFAAPSTFGGVIPTPALDRVAQAGLRYTRFHTTALCSPTRAALLTGRNHHSVGSGVVADQATGYPGYDSILGRDAVAIGEVLRQTGYDTSWYGKDHNVPIGSRAKPVPSTVGRPGQSRASTTITVSSETTPISGSRAICSATPRRLSHSLANPAGIWSPPWPTRRSDASRC